MSYYRTMNKKSIIIFCTVALLSMIVCAIFFLSTRISIHHNDEESPINDPYGPHDEESPINDPYGPPSFSSAPRNIDVNKWRAAEFKGQIEYYKGISALEESKMGGYYAHFIACSKDDRAKAVYFYETCNNVKVYTKENEFSDSLLDKLPYATRLYLRYKGSETRKTYADNKITFYKQMLSNIFASESRKTINDQE